MSSDDAPSPDLSIDGDRCLLGVSAASRCQACADACPHGALLIGEDGLGIVEDACTSCGLCVPACPVGAIEVPIALHAARDGARQIAFAACLPAMGDSQAPGIIPCLHAIGLPQLMDAVRDGIDHFVLCFGDCATCPQQRREGDRLTDRLKLMRRLLESRAFSSPSAEALAADAWLARLKEATTTAGAGPALSRRGLFSRVAPAVVKDRQLPPAVERFYLGLPAIAATDIAAISPVLDEARCSGCDACARICPTEAIALIRTDDGALGYAIEARACNGCRLCIDVCEDAAIMLEGPGAPHAAIMLDERRCRACGVAFHRPKSQGHDRSHCRICEKSNHYANLHQVLK